MTGWALRELLLRRLKAYLAGAGPLAHSQLDDIQVYADLLNAGGEIGHDTVQAESVSSLPTQT